MSSGILFIVSTIVVMLVVLFYFYRTPRNIYEYFNTKDGKGVLAGILMFTGAGILIVVLSTVVQAGEPEGTWFKYGEVFLGLDNTKHQSPMCDMDGPSSRLTSNGGIVLNIFQSGDELFELNSKYTHHSCALNSDNKSYDAVGVELSYKFFNR